MKQYAATFGPKNFQAIFSLATYSTDQSEIRVFVYPGDAMRNQASGQIFNIYTWSIVRASFHFRPSVSNIVLFSVASLAGMSDFHDITEFRTGAQWR